VHLPLHTTAPLVAAESSTAVLLWRLQVLETARAAFEASSQRVSLTNLSGRRDMSLLLALSATQVCCWICG
jgi:hypothetical protein